MISAFDLATTTGGCDGSPDSQPRLFTWELRDGGPSRGRRLLMLHNFLREYFVEVADLKCIDLVVYEAPLNIATMVRIGANDDTVTFLRAAIGILEMQCARLGLRCEAVNVQDARQSVLGWRTNPGGDTKRRVSIEIDRYYDVQAANEHEADAFVIWRYAANRINPRLALAGVPMFRERV